MRLSSIDSRSFNTSRLCAPSRGGGMLAFGGVATSLSGLAMPGHRQPAQACGDAAEGQHAATPAWRAQP